MKPYAHSAKVRAEPPTPGMPELWRWHCTCGAVGPVANVDRKAAERGAGWHEKRTGPPFVKKPRRRVDIP